jgi:hypothetical protein
VVGAHVKINCQTTITGLKGDYSFTVGPGGQYRVIARFEDTERGVVLYGQRTTPDITPNADVVADITLLDPPKCLRQITAHFTVRVDDVGTFGADHNEQSYRKVLHVQYGVASFDEQTGQWVIDPNDPAAVAQRKDVAQDGTSVGDSSGSLKVEVTAQQDLSVVVTLTGSGNGLVAGPVQVTVHDRESVAVPELFLATGGPFNDRAYFREIAITNFPSTAY